jgi:hypothetical protein
MLMKFNFPVVAGLTLVCLLLSGCASAPASRDEVVKERAEQRWEHIFAREYSEAYEYYSPGYRSKFSAVDLEIALRVQKVRWRSAKYLDHTCEEKSCIVRFRLGYRVAAPVPGVDVWNGWSTVEEQWLNTRGEWWFVPDES